MWFDQLTVLVCNCTSNSQHNIFQLRLYQQSLSLSVSMGKKSEPKRKPKQQERVSTLQPPQSLCLDPGPPQCCCLCRKAFATIASFFMHFHHWCLLLNRYRSAKFSFQKMNFESCDQRLTDIYWTADISGRYLAIFHICHLAYFILKRRFLNRCIKERNFDQAHVCKESTPLQDQGCINSIQLRAYYAPLPRLGKKPCCTCCIYFEKW